MTPTITLWPLLAALAAVPPSITAAVFTPDGEMVLVGSQLGIEQRTWPSLQLVRQLTSKLSHVHDLAFSPDGARLAAVGGRPAEAGEVELFEWPQGTPRRRVTVDDELIYQVAWRSDGAQLALASGNYRVSLLSSAGELTRQFLGHSRSVLSVVFLTGDGYLASAGRDNSLRVWNLDERRLQRTLNNHTAAVRDLAIRPGDATRQTVASAGADRTVRIWWPVVGRLVRFVVLPSEPLDIDWTPDGRLILAACRDGHLRAIDPETVGVKVDLRVLDGWAYTVAPAPNGGALVAGAGGVIRYVTS